MAPEIVLGKEYGKECDYWSIGVLTYQLLSSEHPFDGNNEEKIFMKILDCKIDFKGSIWKNVS